MPKRNNATLTAIASLQNADGSFTIQSNPPGNTPDSVAVTLHALMLDLVQDHDVTATITTPLAHYLECQLHFQNFDKTLKTIDTRAVFHALASLYEHEPTSIPADIVAKSIMFLTSHELAVGGPYINTLSTEKTVDFPTNVSISRFIHLVGGPFPTLLTYISDAEKHTKTSTYFTAPWPMQLQIIQMRRNAGLTTPKEEMLELPAQAALSWPCKDPWGLSTTLYGMAALTLALKLSKAAASPLRNDMRYSNGWEKTHAHLLKHAASTYNNDNLISKELTRALARVSRADHGYEIGLLAIRFAVSLSKNRPSDKVLESLGVANLYNWAAYTIYDDILDEDKKISLLPTANTALRLSVELFGEAVPLEDFKAVVRKTFDTVDAANAWELEHCRFPVPNGNIIIGKLPDYTDLRNLYSRSLTHSLPVIGTLFGSGISIEDRAYIGATEAFKHYLVIRQLSDDLHDWQEDIEAGHISYVVASLLHDTRITPKQYDLALLTSRLEQTYFKKTLPRISKEMLARAAKAHELLRADLPVRTVIDELIDRYEKVAHRILSEHNRITTFMRAYEPSD